jgi:hypothetical protein
VLRFGEYAHALGYKLWLRRITSTNLTIFTTAKTGPARLWFQLRWRFILNQSHTNPVSRVQGVREKMKSLSPHLLGFLEGLCAASITRYPEYGMFLRGPKFGNEITELPTSTVSVGIAELQQFFVCALSDTSAQRPEEASYAVERFLSLIKTYHPEAELHFELPETRGWFDGLSVWLRSASGEAYFYLEWSVS